jgi:hypothetical protein
MAECDEMKPTVDNLRDALFCYVDGEISASRDLILVSDASEVLQVATTGLGVHAPSVRLFTVLQWGCDVHEEEVARAAILLHNVTRRVATTLMRGDRRSDHSCTRPRKLCGYPRNPLQVHVPVLNGPPELGR